MSRMPENPRPRLRRQRSAMRPNSSRRYYCRWLWFLYQRHSSRRHCRLLSSYRNRRLHRLHPRSRPPPHFHLNFQHWLHYSRRHLHCLRHFRRLTRHRCLLPH
jgi:hypothetical protein